MKNFFYIYIYFFIQLFLYRLYRCIQPEARILSKREKKLETVSAATRTTLHILQCVRGNRWTDGCKQTRRMSKLLSPMHPLFRFLCSSVLVSHPLPMSALCSRGRVRTHTFSLPSSLRFHLSGQPRSPVSRLSSCDSPTPLCVNSCTHRQRIPTGEHTMGNVYLA